MLQTSLPIQQLATWSRLNGVEIHDIDFVSTILDEDGNDKGGGVLSKTSHEPTNLLVSVPSDLILSKECVLQYARTDHHLQQVLESVGSFAQTPRGAILIFLLLQITINNPDNAAWNIGVKNPLTDYVKFLPKQIPLPTFYSDEERALLQGTSLADALDQKLSSLEKEYEHLQEATSQIPWCQQVWWDEDGGSLTLDDWKSIDAMYRSRAMELPTQIGHAMVPLLDMANHASGPQCNARFEVYPNDTICLQTCDDSHIAEGDEVNITYGCGGACEMIFSYGFLDKTIQSAREMFLGVTFPTDDPLRRAKIAFAEEAPGVRIYLDQDGKIRWESEFLWWACINEEDGLDFQVAQNHDGQMELKAFWKNVEFQARDLKHILAEDKLQDVFRLRATVMVQARVEEQGMLLASSENDFLDIVKRGNVEEYTWRTIERLRDLELDMLNAAFEALDAEKSRLLMSATVRAYLNQDPPTPSESTEPEDFS